MDHVRICPECARRALEQETLCLPAPSVKAEHKQTPEWIERHLSEVVIGQSDAKRMLSIAAWQHMHRHSLPETMRDMVPKHNVLIAGPTGTGKTLMLETLAQLLDVPIVTFDTSTVTKAGYIGAKAEQCVYDLITKAGSLKNAEFGIIHLDEVDKIRRMGGLPGDVGGESAQQSFLKILEGRTFILDRVNSETKQVEKVPFSTKNILFVATGAFPDLYEKHAADTRGGGIGFTAQRSKAAPLTSVTSEQFTRFGMIPEFMRRFPSVRLMQPLSVQDLENILRSSSRSPVRRYAKLLESMHVTSVWHEDCIAEIARRAFAKNIGASGIESVLDEAFSKLLFELPGTVGGDWELELTFFPDFLDGEAPEYNFAREPSSGASAQG
ncbi:hypothetical protein A3G62_02200 [Candidatus Kaiserbacteria bacterium RIFCSPLOWO2_12_FULL_50_10]|nr:MAG: hypothetical protein A3G62_02200 [Candidatus Kaiserbacteria bacterium RIFCSPLOWO2_12_FULL_50_10]